VRAKSDHEKELVTYSIIAPAKSVKDIAGASRHY
jgi:hypothetical protein